MDISRIYELLISEGDTIEGLLTTNIRNLRNYYEKHKHRRIMHQFNKVILDIEQLIDVLADDKGEPFYEIATFRLLEFTRDIKEDMMEMVWKDVRFTQSMQASKKMLSKGLLNDGLKTILMNEYSYYYPVKHTQIIKQIQEKIEIHSKILR